MFQENHFYDDLLPGIAFPSKERFLLVGGKKLNQICSYCFRDLSSQFMVHCAECECFQLCSDCFSVGVELSPHKNTHSYRIVDNLDFPVLTKDWTALEELLLLEGILSLGVGNWKFVAEYIGSGKTQKQVEEHYWDLYMGVHGYCLPRKTLDCVDNIINTTLSDHTDVISPPDDLATVLVTETYFRGEDVQRDRSIAKETNTRVNEVRDKLLQLPGADLSGFMPLREDFDIEYENDAEIILADMEFHPEDHPSERELKLQVVNIYNNKLKERNDRKRFAIERGLVDIKKQLAVDKKLSKDERELFCKFKIFSRLQSAKEHDALVDGLIQARKLRSHIELLQHYRVMGIRTLEQANKYEIEKKKRETELKLRKQRDNNLSDNIRSTSSSSLQDAVNKRIRRSLSSSDISSQPDKIEEVDFSYAPGFDLLSNQEVKLCSFLPMLPLQFLAAKEAIIRELHRNGALNEEGIKRVLKIDEVKATKIVDFFVHSLDINNPDLKDSLYLKPRIILSNEAKAVTDGEFVVAKDSHYGKSKKRKEVDLKH